MIDENVKTINKINNKLTPKTMGGVTWGKLCVELIGP